MPPRKLSIPIPAQNRKARAPCANSGRATAAICPSSGSLSPSQPSDRVFETIQIGSGGLKFEVMIYGSKPSARRPLLVLNSLEFPSPPSVQFCDTMWRSGYQVIFALRPGFGRTTPLPSVLLECANIENGAAITSEMVLLAQLINTLELTRPVIVSNGTATPASYRLCSITPDIALSIFVSPAFNQDVYNFFDPIWFRRMLEQISHSKRGLEITARGLRAILREKPLWVYRQFSKCSDGDLDYIATNKRDLEQAGNLLQAIELDTARYNWHYYMQHDPFLKDGLFQNINAVVLWGQETPQEWRDGLTREAARLDIATESFPEGNYYTPYIDPERFLSLLAKYDRPI